jgi:hypothetical protein
MANHASTWRSSATLHRWHRMVRQVLHEYETALSAANSANCRYLINVRKNLHATPSANIHLQKRDDLPAPRKHGNALFPKVSSDSELIRPVTPCFHRNQPDDNCQHQAKPCE